MFGVERKRFSSPPNTGSGTWVPFDGKKAKKTHLRVENKIFLGLSFKVFIKLIIFI